MSLALPTRAPTAQRMLLRSALADHASPITPDERCWLEAALADPAWVPDEDQRYRARIRPWVQVWLDALHPHHTPQGVLLLDIDGVLRTWPPPCPFFTNTFGRRVPSYNPRAVSALNWLVRESQAALVITSVWREQGHRGMQRDLEDWGVKARIASMTPRSMEPGDTRVDQITRWQARVLFRLWQRPGCHGLIPRMVALDDEPLEVPMVLALRTTITEGLTWDIAETALNYLQTKEHSL